MHSSKDKLFVVFCCLLVVIVGCNGSRWAKRDADYRQKYPKHTSSVPKTIKQAIDARHVRGKTGGYIAGAGRDEPVAAGAEVGVFGYTEPWLEYRVGAAGLVHTTGDHPISGGLLGSARLQVPSRFAPFVGFGVYGGWAGLESAENDNIDNDNNGFVDEDGETAHDWALAMFPEVGAHFWLNHRVRLTTSVNYYVTNQGRDDDFLFYSVGLSFFPNRYEDRPHAPPIDCSTAEDWEFTAAEPLPAMPQNLETHRSSSPYSDLHVEGSQGGKRSAANAVPASVPNASPPAQASPASGDQSHVAGVSYELFDEATSEHKKH